MPRTFPISDHLSSDELSLILGLQLGESSSEDAVIARSLVSDFFYALSDWRYYNLARGEVSIENLGLLTRHFAAINERRSPLAPLIAKLMIPVAQGLQEEAQP